MSTPAAKPQESTASSLLRPTVEAITTFVRSASQRRTSRPPLIFPPPSWNLEETQNNGAGASHVPDEPIIPKEFSEDAVPMEDAPEPQAFARRISSLIDELPPPPITNEGAPMGDIDPKGPPLPPAVSKDSKLMKLLSSEHVMNGSLSRGRQSVWSVLEHLKHKAGSIASPAEPQKGNTEQHNHDREDEGVMMYGPLEPTPDSKLEIADSEIVLEYFDEPEPEKPVEDTTKPPPDASKIPPNDAPKTAPAKKPPANPNRTSRFKERTYWVPSSTKISLQASWWGYRLYLPPPIMKILDNSHLAAAKRGAMIAASLKWMLDRVPLVAIPLQFRPAMRVLKRLTPYLGYIGVFVAWSWNAIKARDKGDGVVLTATWLLPVALVPGTLKPEDFQRGNGGANETVGKAKESRAKPQVPAGKRSQPPSKGGTDKK
ncbi:hypothetical protein FB45DRAFT_1066122 [Roridomyces roridus]|uniref:Uncharacterized protein n=1 Tax=Roridomyces roridus TaxID=1738132 RepID=A0AAD7FBU8_9AGAR|nr:hypothetical protein FB45DRAFT_1066122 [Roridomyces roridus]